MSDEGKEPYQRLVNMIHETDEKLNTDKWILKQKIDMNHPDWRELAMHKAEFFFQRNRSDIINCSWVLVHEFPLVDSNAYRKDILFQIRQTATLKNHLTLSTDCDTDTNFRNNIILHLLLDLGADSRDWILSLHDCTEKALQHKLDVTGHLNDLLYLANDADHHGIGSAKKMMEDTLRKYCPYAT